MTNRLGTAHALARDPLENNVTARVAVSESLDRCDDKALVPEVTEQAALAEALRLARAGVSFRAIRRALTAVGIKPHRGSMRTRRAFEGMLHSKIVAV